MTTEKRKSTNTSADLTPPDFDIPSSPLIPPVEVAPITGGYTDLNRWAEERVSIYASLDANMTRHIIEAIEALSELKQRAEEEAFQAGQNLVSERDRLKREISNLRQEYSQMQDDLKESRRLANEEAARLMAEQRGSSAQMLYLQTERDELQLQVRKLQAQLQEAQRDLQTVYRNRADAIEAGGSFAAWRQNQPARLEQETSVISSPHSEPTSSPIRAPRPSKAKDDEFPLLSLLGDEEPIISPPPAEFDDTPTPQIPGGSPIVQLNEAPPADEVEAAPVSSEIIAPVESIEAIEPVTVEGDDQDEVKQFLNELVAVEKLNDLPEAPVLGAVPAEKTRDRNRRTRTEQRVSHLMNKRRTNGSPADGEALEILPAPPIEPSNSPRNRTNKRRTIQPAQPVQPADSDKVSLRELGLQLGLDAMTPPPVASFQFAPGYTPPPEPAHLKEVMAELRANANAINAHPSAAIQLPSTPISPTLQDLIEPEEGTRTLEQLLEAGEQELAEINENPTPPEDPSPFIGNLSDYAASLQPDLITPPSYAEEVVVNPRARSTGALDPAKVPAEISFSDLLPTPTPAPIQVPVKTPTPRASGTTPSGSEGGRRRRTTNNLGGFLPLPPPPAQRPDSEVGETQVTKLNVSNLQGRYSPLIVEKVVRSLEEVIHVIVTDFSKGVLGMDVRYKKDFDLAQKLLSMEELHLKLVSQEMDVLEFTQETI